MPRSPSTRVLSLSRRDFAIVAEAAALVVPIEVGLRSLSLDALLARLGRASRGAVEERAHFDVDRAGRLVDAVAACYPPATCLKKSLILFRILGRRACLRSSGSESVNSGMISASTRGSNATDVRCSAEASRISSFVNWMGRASC